MNIVGLKGTWLGDKKRHRLNSFSFRFYGTTVLFFFYFLFPSICLGQEMTLAQQLDGLEPKPRIAYLKYLINEKGGNSDIYFNLGLAFQEEAEGDSAIYYYEMAVSEDSTMFKAFANLGVINDNMGNYPGAIRNYRKALEIQPDAVLPNSHIAHLYYRMGNYSSAIKYLMKALRNNPKHPQPHFYLAIFFWDSMMYQEAINEWKIVIKLAPGDYLARKARENIAMVKRVMLNPSLSLSKARQLR
ncbi:tetratricopeptide repeat protein [bacterium]|nr:tetratricopeptide repeat protein [bacterium]